MNKPHPAALLARIVASHHKLAVAYAQLLCALEICDSARVDRYDAAAGAIARATRRLQTESTSHERVEEALFLPLLADVIPDRAPWLAAHRADHRRLDEAWQLLLPGLMTLQQQLEQGGCPDPLRVGPLRRQVEAYIHTSRAHMALEERELLPLVGCALDDRTLRLASAAITETHEHGH